MTKDEMLSELRGVLFDTIEQYAWSDLLLLGYLDEGQDRFCTDTGLFTDATTYSVTLESGVRTYAIDPKIISVLDVFNGTQRLLQYNMWDLYYPFTHKIGVDVSYPPGIPGGWAVDVAQGVIGFDRTPTDAEIGTDFQLRVWRYSLHSLLDSNTVELELPPHLQRACIEWAAFKAFSHHDQEQQDPVKAADHQANYKKYVSDGKAYERRITSRSVHIGGNQLYRV